MPLDYTYRIQIPHRAGQLATVAGTIAEGGGLIGDVTTINVGRESSMREITLEIEDRDQAERIIGMLNELDGVRVVWARDRALLKHEGGKLVIESAHPVRTVQDMRDVYTPGVARACQAIVENPSLASELTMIGRSVAICTNGTRVLGLGDIGPVASMPVMEGKAVFYHQLAGVSAMPILVDTKDVDEFVETVVRIAPPFGGIHLEDISAPARRVLASDPNPLSHERARAKGIEITDMQTVMDEADVVVATTGVPGLIEPEMVREGQVILAITNPYPEIEPEDALAAGAAFAADGKSVNNVLGYPGIFRGALLCGAKQINPEMKIAAAEILASLTTGDELVPDALDPNVHLQVAGAVREAAIASGAARLDRAPTGL
ncbi:MAG: NADP-dependent malic enzyme [Rubrobacteraceae bacterium]|nr:NADP-dependent malic enzyme [Rubrobacteraceae bacterium]